MSDRTFFFFLKKKKKLKPLPVIAAISLSTFSPSFSRFCFCFPFLALYPAFHVSFKCIAVYPPRATTVVVLSRDGGRGGGERKLLKVRVKIRLHHATDLHEHAYSSAV